MNENFFEPNLEDPKPEEDLKLEYPHTPESLRLQEKYGKGHTVDERGFVTFDGSIEDPEYFEKELALMSQEMDPTMHKSIIVEYNQKYKKTVGGLIESLGRLPEPAEVERELFRLRLLRQVSLDFVNPGPYQQAEVQPQQEVIKKRQEDFPDPENALEAFENGKARIEEQDGIVRLIISVPNQEGKMIDHPVMTNEEIQWVIDSAEMIARSMEGNKKGKVFIAGLGLGLLNKELEKKGIKNQVVAELNHDVIDLVGKKVEEECPDVNLDLRQGDFKEILIETIKNKEEFEAISIDAFPNSAEDVNCDASNNEVLKLAWKALKPGGILTFYPDSRYIPSRILNILHDLEVPETSIHYTVAKFKTSEFTKNYHYGELMAVPAIQKPLLLWKDNQAKVNELVKEYYNTLDEKISAYVKKHKDELTSTVNDSKDNLEEAA